ncbi:MAG TPA: AAA family ATPase [Solirubrobacteraceae bacterium]
MARVEVGGGPLERIRTNLPSAPGELFGRDDELAVLLDLIATARLVTVSGPGGAGKTRLALEVAHRAAEGFDAVWFVALEQVPDSNDVMGALARVMGLPEMAEVDPAERVLAHLSARSALLVLDNLEHLLEVAPLVGQVARAGPGVRVLVTSEAPLRVGGEHVLGLDPLTLPTGAERELQELRAVPSVALLMQRAAAVGTGFELTQDNRFDVAHLCRQLDGVPLALELTAPRLEAIDAAALSRRLEQERDALDSGGTDLPARQRGLRAVLEWTVGLLSEAERSALLRLSVFAAGFSADLAEAAFGDIIDALQALLDIGLVHPGAPGRFEIRPPVRRFALQQLDAEEDDAAHAAIADALIARAEPFEKRWVVLADQGWLALNPESGNIFSELDWASLMDYGRHARLAAATGWWMKDAGAGEYARDHLEIALARTTDARMRARCLQALGTLGAQDSDPSGCLDAADAWHDLGDLDGEFYSAIYGATLYGHAREGEAEMDVLERCAALAAAAPDPDKEWMLEVVRAEAVWLLGHPEEALGPLLSRLQETPPGSWKEYWVATRLADLELALHRFASALEHDGAAMAVMAAMGTALGQLNQAAPIAVALLHLGRLEEAAATWAVCELGYDELSWPPTGVLGEYYEAVRASLDEARLAAGRERAARMGLERGLVWVGDVARGKIAPG